MGSKTSFIVRDIVTSEKYNIKKFKTPKNQEINLIQGICFVRTDYGTIIRDRDGHEMFTNEDRCWMLKHLCKVIYSYYHKGKCLQISKSDFNSIIRIKPHGSGVMSLIGLYLSDETYFKDKLVD